MTAQVIGAKSVEPLCLAVDPGAQLFFDRWRTLRVAGPLRQIAQDAETGPIPLAAVHAADGLQQLLAVTADGQNMDPDTMSLGVMKENLRSAKESLDNAVANIDIMLGLIEEAEAHLRLL
jgi:hypothetical protein